MKCGSWIAVQGTKGEREEIMSFSSIAQAIDAIKKGRMIIVVDDENRENEGDLLIAADTVRTEDIAFMMRLGQGLICAALPGERLDELEIPLMVENNTDRYATAFTVSVDYRFGTSTGISAADRAATIRALLDANTRPDDFARPGHVFPLRANPGGVLSRRGHTEAAIDLTSLAGRIRGGVICEIAKGDGSMMRLDDLIVFARAHSLPIVSIEALVEYLTCVPAPTEALTCASERPVLPHDPRRHWKSKQWA
jgi:3,4-dihydroxy-2-butanone 4-phosphate synthase